MRNIPTIIKENQEQRLERLRYSSCTRTQVIPNKKKQTRSQLKQIMNRERY